MLFFDEMLNDLVQLWAQHAIQMDDEGYRASFTDRVDTTKWEEYPKN